MGNIICHILSKSTMNAMSKESISIIRTSKLFNSKLLVRN